MALTLGEVVKGRETWPRILDTLMPGGANWEQYQDRGGKCAKSCPGWTSCRVSGPDGLVCSTKWRNAEASPLTFNIVRHVLQNFQLYDQGDCKVHGKAHVIAGFLAHINRQADEASDDEYKEGGEKLRLHKYRERSSKAAKTKKQEALSAGHLRCEACLTDYLALFSEIEALRIIECHHKKPLSSLKFMGTTKKSELALLCANCHRLAHSTIPPLSIRQVSARRMRANKWSPPTQENGRGGAQR